MEVYMKSLKRTAESRTRGGAVHIQASVGITLCGRHLYEAELTTSKPTCKQCIKHSQRHIQEEKTCTICGETKDIGQFYYDVATDTNRSNCTSCTCKLVTMRRQYARVGKKLTVKEFRQKRLYQKSKELVKA